MFYSGIAVTATLPPGLCADAAPVLLPWIDEYAGRDTRKAAQAIQQQLEKRYINRLQQRLEQSGSPLQYNVSRDIARRELEKMGYDGQ